MKQNWTRTGKIAVHKNQSDKARDIVILLALKTVYFFSYMLDFSMFLLNWSLKKLVRCQPPMSLSVVSSGAKLRTSESIIGGPRQTILLNLQSCDNINVPNQYEKNEYFLKWGRVISLINYYLQLSWIQFQIQSRSVLNSTMEAQQASMIKVCQSS